MTRDMFEIPNQGSGTQTLACRRCGGAFLPPEPAMRLPCCPHCGASMRGLWRLLPDNRVSAVLAVSAAIVLTVALTLPFVGMEQFGVFHSYSLLGGILELLRRGYLFIGIVLLLFSV